jgi:hypothetical protein
MVDMQLIVRLLIKQRSASITRMIRHYVSRSRRGDL